VNDLLLIVHVPQNRQQTNEQLPNYSLFEIFALFALVSDKLREIRSLDYLHDDVKIILLDKGFVKLDNVRMLEFFINFDLSELFVDLVAGHLRDLNSFESIFVVSFLGQVNATKSASAQFFDQAVTADDLKLKILVSDHFGQLFILILNVENLTIVHLLEGLETGLVAFIGLDKVPNINEPP